MSLITQGKTNLKYILIVVVLAVIVGGGWFLLQQQEGVVTSGDNIQPDSPTQDVQDKVWTYQNEKLGYVIDFPKGWEEIDCIDSRYNEKCFVSDDYLTDFEPLPKQGVYFSISAYDKSADAGDVYKCGTNSLTCRDIVINNIPAALFGQQNKRTLPDGTDLTRILANFYKNDYLFYNSALFPEPCEFELDKETEKYRMICEDDPETVETIYQIISSIRFNN